MLELVLHLLPIPRSHPSASKNFNHYSVSCRRVYINSNICERIRVSEQFDKTIVSAWIIAVSMMLCNGSNGKTFLRLAGAGMDDRGSKI